MKTIILVLTTTALLVTIAACSGKALNDTIQGHTNQLETIAAQL